jgi:Mannosyl-glycoprotein endo-beta-N-acetylglucosaminidase
MSQPPHPYHYHNPYHFRPLHPYRPPRPRSRTIIAIILLTVGGMALLLVPVIWLFTWLISRPAEPTEKPFVPPPSKYSVVGKPSIDVDFINQVLEQYDSPAQGKGQSLYDYGVKYHIDPAYALAFFMHESTFGTKGVATKTLSLGNIRATKGHPSYHGYRQYPSWEAGFEDWYRLIANTYVQKWRLYTVDQIIPVYAPAADKNTPAAYIRAVKNAINTWHQGIVEV